ncbi:MAG TPA: methyltransferase domain-containing protein [Methanotrichaceae archaeon]|nr:methyltransferase domain-containing protein [Methanotrichaceae archaeon]
MNRFDFVIAHCWNKKVLHIGCAGNGLLHRKLSNVAYELHGLDIDRDGLELLERMGFGNLHEGDAEHLDIGGHWDAVVATEMMEHLANPGLFLDGLRALDAHEYLITVPNGLRWQLREKVWGEHVAWYSPATLRTALELHGFAVDEIVPCAWNRLYGRLGFWPLAFEVGARCH